MRAVLLDRRHRQHGNRRLRIDRGVFGGPVVAPPNASVCNGHVMPLDCEGDLARQTSPVDHPAAIASTSTLNSGRAKPDTIISVEAGAGLANKRSRTSI